MVDVGERTSFVGDLSDRDEGKKAREPILESATLFDWVGVIAIRPLSLFLQVLPLDLALWIGRLAGNILSRVTARRRVAYVNLKAAFGVRYNARERREIVRKVFLNLAQNAVEVLRFPKLNPDYIKRYITVERQDRYEQAVAGKDGTILITPHFGNWELTQILSALSERPMYILAREQKHDRLNAFLNELRTSHGSFAVHKGSGIRDLIRSLRRRELVGVLGDLSGGKLGAAVQFFGRKTTAPAGIFEIARRNRATILPCFMLRTSGPCHHVFIEEPFRLEDTGDDERDLREDVQNYYRLLESWIERYPEQWFWIYKRWKYCFTKRILILKDDRAGHTNQSEGIRKELEALQNTLGRRYEFEFTTIEVRFKSGWHRRFFYLFAFFFRPFAQSKLDLLTFFFEPACAEALRDTHADVIISAGSGLAPLSLVLKEENLAKSIVVMKPSFPYSFRLFDLLIVPSHDQLPVNRPEVVRTLVAPNRVDETLLQTSMMELKKRTGLDSNGISRISVFIGGGTRSYRLEPTHFQAWLETLKSCAEEFKYELLITTSRRTDPEIASLLKQTLGNHPLCKLLVIANESNIQNVTYGMLALSDIVLVTEDSISMISEAVSAGKNVLVIRIGDGMLSQKHERFRRSLESNLSIRTATGSDFRSKLLEVAGRPDSGDALRSQSHRIQDGLRKALGIF